MEPQGCADPVPGAAARLGAAHRPVVP